MKSKFAFLLIILSCLMSSSLYAGWIYYKNNSNYDIRIWEMLCGIENDGTQDCTKEYYAGYIQAHQMLDASKNNKKQKMQHQAKAGIHVTRATINDAVSSFDSKGLITEFPICNSIQENHVKTMLTFDVDPNTGAVTCKETIIA